MTFGMWIGASGIHCMTNVIAPTLVPKAEFGRYIAIVSTVFALASILGPLLGGVVSANGSWRWVFFLKYELLISFGFETTMCLCVCPALINGKSFHEYSVAQPEV